MPVNFHQIVQQLEQIVSKADLESRTLIERRENARQAFAGVSQDLEKLQGKVEQAAKVVNKLRVGKPTVEAVNQVFPLPTKVLEETIVIAADGSQIYPDHHEALNFSLINVGILEYPPGNNAPVTSSYSELKYGSRSEVGSADEVNFNRDILERRCVVDLLPKYQSQTDKIITLSDGPLEIWLGAQEQLNDQKTLEMQLKPYLNALGKLRDYGTITAGYVDKPRASMIVQLLEIIPLEFDQLRDYRKNPAFEGVTDVDLLAPLLKTPGDRSAIFEIESWGAGIYRREDPDLTLNFFYMNVGSESRPWLVRVEIPQWVARSAEKLNTIQKTLLDQCGIIDSLRYPYVLHRAHEEAVVKQAEKQEIIQMLLQELQKRDFPYGQESYKQSYKNLTGRRRFSLGSKKH
jgi:hypothetical protein